MKKTFSTHTRSISRQGMTLAIGLTLAAGLPLGIAGCDAPRVVKQSLTLTSLKGEGYEALAQGDFVEARRVWGEFVEMRPHSAEGRVGLAKAELGMGNASAAREHLRVARDLEPGNEEYLELLAEAMYQAGDRDALVELLEQETLVGSDPDDYYRLARYLRKMGLVDEAERTLLTAAAIYGDRSPTPHRELADFYRALGDQSAEVERLRMILSFNPEDRTATSRLRELGEIPGPSFAIEPNANP